MYYKVCFNFQNTNFKLKSLNFFFRKRLFTLIRKIKSEEKSSSSNHYLFCDSVITYMSTIINLMWQSKKLEIFKTTKWRKVPLNVTVLSNFWFIKYSLCFFEIQILCEVVFLSRSMAKEWVDPANDECL
jgi:hypothetical protein